MKPDPLFMTFISPNCFTTSHLKGVASQYYNQNTWYETSRTLHGDEDCVKQIFGSDV